LTVKKEEMNKDNKKAASEEAPDTNKSSASQEKNTDCLNMDDIAADSANEVESALSVAKEEAAALRDQFLRIAAEFDNYKKRATREYDEFKKYANVSMIKALLPSVDNLERALSASSSSETSSVIVDGVKMVLNDMLKVFESFQVKIVDAEGKMFDPAFHQAIMQEETEGVPENQIIKVFQNGYIMHDRLIRPAMVVVAKAPAKQQADN